MPPRDEEKRRERERERERERRKVETMRWRFLARTTAKDTTERERGGNRDDVPAGFIEKTPESARGGFSWPLKRSAILFASARATVDYETTTATWTTDDDSLGGREFYADPARSCKYRGRKGVNGGGGEGGPRSGRAQIVSSPPSLMAIKYPRANWQL